MAKKTVLVDDLDGGEADQTIAFVVDGEAYSLDLSTKNAEKFRKVLAPYIDAARRGRETQSEELSAISQRAAIREWAKSAGLDVSERGRIPQDILDAYRNR